MDGEEGAYVRSKHGGPHTHTAYSSTLPHPAITRQSTQCRPMPSHTRTPAARPAPPRTHHHSCLRHSQLHMDERSHGLNHLISDGVTHPYYHKHVTDQTHYRNRNPAQYFQYSNKKQLLFKHKKFLSICTPGQELDYPRTSHVLPLKGCVRS